MSFVHDMLNKVEAENQVKTTPWGNKSGSESGLFVFDLPNEILNDFYDLKEYIRIANLHGNMRVLSIASASHNEGSSTIATYLSFLMSGGLAQKLEKQISRDVVGPDKMAMPGEEENHTLFSDEFRDLASSKVNEELDAEGELTMTVDDINPEEDILLIDGNLHNPSLHRYFGLEAESGLSDIITNNLDWRQIAKPVHDSNLRIITAGYTKSNPADLLSSDSFFQLVSEWRETFKYVIFDSSPVLQYVDSMSLASAVDGVVLVVKAGQTRWELAQHAKRKLANAQATLLGVALNRQKMEIPDGQYKRLMV